MGLELKRPHPNKKRADKAEKAIRGAYRNDERILTPEDITDILTDIRHLCDHREIDLDASLESSHRHYLSEIIGGE